MAYCRLCEAEAAFLIRSPVTALGCFLIGSRLADAARRKYISCGFDWTLCVSIVAVWFAEFMSVVHYSCPFIVTCLYWWNCWNTSEQKETKYSCASSHEGEQIVCFYIYIHVQLDSKWSSSKSYYCWRLKEFMKREKHWIQFSSIQ